ncbi:MAG: Gldg family protein [Planctomycetaceae bacterium]|nr:Gldg family protein [Planctomycetaceae bacterium]
MPRSHVVFSIFQRNAWSYFAGTLGYLFMVVFVVLGALAAFQQQFFANNLANLDQLNQWYPLLLLFIVPAITMGTWSDEKKLGTEELLFTLPVSDLEVLLGKYWAVSKVFSIILVFSLTHTLVLAWIGDPDWGLMFANYLGYWLAGCALLGCGMLGSYLTNSSTVGFVLGAVLAGIPVVPQYIPQPEFVTALTGNDDLFSSLSVAYHLRPFGLGLIPLSGIVYFVSIAVITLYINLVLIGERHWRGGKQAGSMGLQYAVRAVAVTVTLFAVNALVAGHNADIDMTSERLYTLTPTTRKLISELDGKRPVTIQAFVSADVPRDYVPVKSTLTGLLSQYRQLGGGKITIRQVEVQPFSEQAEEARRYGIVSRSVQSERGGRLQVDDVFLGAVINSGANEVVIPFFDIAIPVEYELTRSVRTVASAERKTIGILETDAKINGGFDMSSFRSQPQWRIVEELKKQYNVETVQPTGPIDDKKYDVLVAVLPSSLNQQGMANLVDYVRKGRPTLIFDDPIPAFNPSLAPRQPKPRPGGGMMGQGGPPEPKADGGQATSLVNLLGIEWIFDEVVWDNTILSLHPEYADVVRPEMVAISRQSGVATAFNPDNEVTSGLQELLAFFPGTLKARSNSKLKFQPLLKTGPDSGLLAWDKLVRPGFFGGVEIENNPVRKADEYSHILAAQITSDGKSPEKIDAIFVADTDMISDWFFMVRERRMYGLDLDNVTFVLNCVDQLADDGSYINLRKRRAKHRTLLRVEQASSKFVAERTAESEKANTEAQKELDEAKARFAKQVEEIRNDNNLDDVAKLQKIAIAQETEQRRVSVAEANIEQAKEKRVAESRAKTERQIRSIESRYWLAAVFLPPIPAILLGLFVWAWRLQNEQKDISPARRVKKV